MFLYLFSSQHRVFVYGTLRQGQQNFYLISDESKGSAKFIGLGKTVHKYPLVVSGRYNTPFLLPVQGTGKVSFAVFFQKINLNN